MAEPYHGSILDEIHRDQMHVRDIQATLKFLQETLGQEQIPFALIGALALRHYGYTRFTEDIEILTTREGLDRIHETLVGRGLVPRAAGLRKKLRQTQFKVSIDIVTAGEHAGSRESPTVFPDPQSDAFIERDGIRVARLETLIALKISSGVWAHRPQDLVDVIKLIQANKLSESFADELPSAVRAKFQELLVESRLERELEE